MVAGLTGDELFHEAVKAQENLNIPSTRALIDDLVSPKSPFQMGIAICARLIEANNHRITEQLAKHDIYL